jgi:hypothetical protein
MKMSNVKIEDWCFDNEKIDVRDIISDNRVINYCDVENHDQYEIARDILIRHLEASKTPLKLVSLEDIGDNYVLLLLDINIVANDFCCEVLYSEKINENED